MFFHHFERNYLVIGGGVGVIGLPISRKKDLSLSRGGFRYGKSDFEVKNDEKQAPEVKNEKKL